MSKQTVSDYTWTYSEQPHRSRRKEILAKHPEVKNLFGFCPRQKYWVTLSVVAQIFFAYLLRDQSWWLIIPLAYVVGGTINHSLFLAFHELAHNLFFDRPVHNTLFGFFANLPMTLAITVSFQKYHMLHHRFQGELGGDPDLPHRWEGEFFNTAPKKFLFLCLQFALYTLRPLFGQPLPLTNWEIAQWIFQLSMDALFWYFVSFKALAYLFLSSCLGASFHPLIGHLIAEHYEWVPGQETYSYYGWMNFLTYNAGYHNEHHDFPRIAGSRLPELKAIAPEYYDSLASVSWVGVVWRFIWDPKITPFSRTVRKPASHTD